MSCTYVIDQGKRLVITSASGIVTAAEAFSHQNRLSEDSAFSPEFCQLIDCTQLTKVQMGATELRTLAKKHFFSPNSRRAILVNSPSMFGLGRMLVTFRDIAGGKEAMQIFRDREEAMLWLLQG